MKINVINDEMHMLLKLNLFEKKLKAVLESSWPFWISRHTSLQGITWPLKANERIEKRGFLKFEVGRVSEFCWWESWLESWMRGWPPVRRKLFSCKYKSTLKIRKANDSGSIYIQRTITIPQRKSVWCSPRLRILSYLISQSILLHRCSFCGCSMEQVNNLKPRPFLKR